LVFAVAAEQALPLAAEDLQVNVIQLRTPAIGQGDFVKTDDGHGAPR